MGNINVPKIGTFETAINIDSLLEGIKQRSSGEASYPDWLTPNSKIELILKGPFRIMYFMFSPFPWEAKKILHLAGMLDGLIFIMLVIIIFRNRKAIFSNPALRTISLIILTYIIVFGLSIGNFGTAIRHRTKFFISIILLIAPWIPRIIYTKKIKK